MKPHRDLYQETTDRLIAALEAGTRPWQRDWLTTGEPIRSTGQAYRGINFILLSLTAQSAGYTHPRWITFKQAQELGGNVRKGERGTPIVFFKKLEVAAGEGAGEDERRSIPMMRGYTVFNVEQCDGLADRFPLPVIADLPAKQRDEQAEATLRATGATIKEGGNSAFYSPATDHIQLPAFEAFQSTGGFLATLAHELVHWTGAKHRLARDMSGGFGSANYAREELVAEMGAAFIGARLGIAGDHFDNHAAYLANWLQVLRTDKKAIFKAAAAAQLAADHILPA